MIHITDTTQMNFDKSMSRHLGCRVYVVAIVYQSMQFLESCVEASETAQNLMPNMKGCSTHAFVNSSI